MIRMLTDAPFDVGDYISLHRAQCAVSRRLAARLCGGSKTHQRLFLSHPGGHSRTSLGSRSVYRERSVVGFAR